jgi:hypothetical protein
MPLSRDLREFIECLNSNEVEYLAAGALAASWHGFPRYSADIDFPIRPSQVNAERALRAIAQFGFGSLGISTADLTVPGKVIQLGFEPNRIDLMTSVTGVTFDADGMTGPPDSSMACPSISSGEHLSSVTKTLLAAPRTASTPRNSGSRSHRRSLLVAHPHFGGGHRPWTNGKLAQWAEVLQAKPSPNRPRSRSTLSDA